MIFNHRRNFLKQIALMSRYSLVASLGGLYSQTVEAKWLADLFSASPMDETLTHSLQEKEDILNKKEVIESDKIHLKLPLIAENGAVVPISVTSNLENVEQVYIFVEKNPIPLVAVFDLSPDLESFVSARIKMAKTSDVIVVVKSESKFYKVKQKVKVTIGGCGG